MRIIIATSGSYSDYRLLAVLEWLGEMTPEAARDEYMAQKAGGKMGDPLAFIGWLTQKGYVQDLECEELHIEEYYKGEDERFPSSEYWTGWSRGPVKD